ncbi:Resuscitation-promoting factor RpfC [Mycobacterium decipiens]|uniref:Resuscitation-promoting factor RpfC n=2 Tax=Mycobacterium decipiens TaxID=1430326 RepID=A0A1X2LSK3_9MYCO|nr:Resuscitation-promoting factor RpfC [Mycobacterium decipiens]
MSHASLIGNASATPGDMSDMTNVAKPLIKSALVAGSVAASMSLSTAAAHALPSPNWDAVAQCESGGNWAANTGNGKYGGLQFKPATWAAFGGVGNPAAASREQQIVVANRVLAEQGLDAWPKCGASSGLPIALWSKPAQGLKQIINEIIWASIQASIPR